MTAGLGVNTGGWQMFSKTRERRWRNAMVVSRVLDAIAVVGGHGEAFSNHCVADAIPFKRRPHINTISNIISMLVADGYAVLQRKKRDVKWFVLVDDQEASETPLPRDY